MSTEEPATSAEPPVLDAPPLSAPPPAPEPRSAGAPSGNGPALIIIAIIVLAALAAFAISQSGSWLGARTSADAYTVQPYTPPSELISAGDHVLAHARPDPASPSVVMFGPGVALTVTGRVSRGFGNDWYAITWNGQTAFVRQQDAIPGNATAPPPTAPRVAPLPSRIDDKPDTDEEGLTEDFPPSPPAASGPFELSGVRWANRPGRRDYDRAYPRRALYDGQSGRVTLDCVASGSGALNCSVTSESPRGYGFGEAALNLSRQFRLRPTTSDGRSVGGGHIGVPVEFRAD